MPPTKEQIEAGERLGYNAAKIPTHPPESPPNPEAETSSQETESPPIASGEVSQSQEIEAPETEIAQRKPDTSDRQQEEKESDFSGKFIDVPVNAPQSESTEISIQRKFNSFELENGYKSPSISRVEPLLNQSNSFSQQQLSTEETLQRRETTEEFKPKEEEEIQQEEPKPLPESKYDSELARPTAKTIAEVSWEEDLKKEPQIPQNSKDSAPLKPKKLAEAAAEIQLETKESQNAANLNSNTAKTAAKTPTITKTETPLTNTPQTVENQQPETETKEKTEQKAASQLDKKTSTDANPTDTQPGNATATPNPNSGTGFSGGGGDTPAIGQKAIAISAEDPAQILAQLKNTPPTQAIATYSQAQTASTQALEKQRQNLQKTIPEIPAPTGLPGESAATSEKTVAQAVEKAGVTKETPDINTELNQSGTSGNQYDPKVPEIPPPKPQTATQLTGGNVEKEGESDPALSQSAQNALANVSLDTSQVSTSAGVRPNVDLAGEANPSQLDATQAKSSQEVQAAKTEAAAQMNQDFGENKIFPQSSNEILKANKELSAVAVSGGKAGENPAIPGEVVGSLNQSLSPFLREKIGAEEGKYQAGKDKFDLDSVKARSEADTKISGLNEETKQKQLTEQKQAQAEVLGFKQEWKTELDSAEKDYQEKAGKATKSQRDKIGQEKSKGEKEAAKHLEDAEKKATDEKQKSDEQANQKKTEASKESGGFWGWVKSKAKALIDGLKEAVNFIYDNFRKAVKAIFEAAKKLAVAAIDLAGKAIVGLIKGFGEILKGLVKVVFAAFPGIAKKINAKIDQAINKAAKAVNAAADLLKKGVSAILDFLANTLDTLLKLVQDIYNGIFTVIGMLINGEFAELLKRIGNLVEAAKAAPPQFETAGYEELLGGNLDQPLSPAELAQAGVNPPGAVGGSTGQMGESSELPTAPWTEENVGVDAVENNMELSPELSAELMEQTQGEGEVMLEQSNDESRSMEAILAEASGQEKEGGEQQEQPEQQYPDDGLSPKQRAEIKWQLMKKGIADWWSNNWPTVIGAGVVGVAGFIAANIVTGGAITAALPAIMGVVGPLFAGLTVMQLAGHVRDYLSKGWAGDIQGGGKSLAKGLAAGAIELVSWLTFKAGGAALKGAKAAVKGAKNVVKGGLNLAKKAAQAVIKGVKYIIEKGKVLFKGIAGAGIGKGFKKLKDLGKELLERMRFKAFRIRIANRRFKLEGLINPWVLLATGEVKYFDSKDLNRSNTGNYKLGEKITTAPGDAGVVVGVTKKASHAVKELQTHLPRFQALADANGIPRNQILDLYEYLGTRGVKNLATQADDEILAALKAVELEKLDAGHSIARHGSQASNPALKKRITQGIAPDGKISPASPSTRFKNYKDWVDTRKAGLDAIETHYSVDLSKGPGIGGNPPDNSYKIVAEHTSHPDLGKGFYGTGTPYKTSITSGGVTKKGKVFPGTAPVNKGINRTVTTIEWIADPSLVGGGRWKVVQHIPWARDFDFVTNTYTIPADYVIP
ncbi:hypothetical protein [Limnofasciculus baicalensis]|uniref:Uncharacterized protein n=1 Tax=Limnofasciculus baicalensis BBK-W-15 TaxID=2699891 RepID=A0AAE3GXC2_9CYAN|nr:hypothetical protein [Limnofasciculus baicalensis]MCP2731553.1 hypothetical protein [Limnofasciculus baicalensis BBK-W-15]